MLRFKGLTLVARRAGLPAARPVLVPQVAGGLAADRSLTVGGRVFWARTLPSLRLLPGSHLPCV